ncbi:hypothetical protein CHLNCDRAFT_137177 [Chlorella variabilis]|uniref:Aminotransferase class IV n=1 Tax=Chlorella variabilis TaxID=554065 RepID=E1ZLF0_CHLVA|nr:hypothetical protein CHLNCDRAFT_137177 [Chlorella variabilis]EFN53257.1 hypothetical protein CHLNCDRAFT_137177 [Chlorella variabilis]|eukprot:XP_005845359.1 hypothetical protein CHLNCDRAFT_137177 [Chlorella variabilis]
MFFLVENGKGRPCEQASGPWLEAAPRGAYTTARTVGGSSVLELSFHIQRLATSAGLMMEAAAGAASAPAAAAAAADVARLRPRVLAAMQAAVRGYRAASGDADGEVRLTVLVTWQACQAQDGQQEAAPPVAGAGAGNHGSSAAASPAGGAGEEGAFDVLVHVSALPPRPAPPVRVVMRGAPRHNAEAKDSEWVRQRRGLLHGLPPGVEEVLLVGEGGALLEGLSSNFFAVARGAVHTAGEGILAGTVREVVLAVARREGIPVVLEPPRLADLEAWDGCFITSTSRLLLPVDEAGVFPEGGSAASAAADADADGTGASRPLQRVRRFERGGLVQRLEALVLAELERRSEPLLG